MGVDTRHTVPGSSPHPTSPRCLQTLPQAQRCTLHCLHLSLRTARLQPNLRLCPEMPVLLIAAIPLIKNII